MNQKRNASGENEKVLGKSASLPKAQLLASFVAKPTRKLTCGGDLFSHLVGVQANSSDSQVPSFLVVPGGHFVSGNWTPSPIFYSVINKANYVINRFFLYISSYIYIYIYMCVCVANY